MITIQLLPDNLLWLECIIRVLLAIVLGFALGVERQLRLKVAGIRIHVVVAAGAALFTIVSLYGFTEAGNSRVAAQIVTGIGFIGAGTIMYKNSAVHGLTSAAGIWLTAAIAMTVGAGMYLVSSVATVLTILIQLFLHLPLRLFKEKHYNEIRVCFKSPTDENIHTIKKLFEITYFTEFKAVRVDDDVIYNAVIHTRKQVDATFVRNAIDDYPYIISLEKIESDR